MTAFNLDEVRERLLQKIGSIPTTTINTGTSVYHWSHEANLQPQKPALYLHLSEKHDPALRGPRKYTFNACEQLKLLDMSGKKATDKSNGNVEITLDRAFLYYKLAKLEDLHEENTRQDPLLTAFNEIPWIEGLDGISYGSANTIVLFEHSFKKIMRI